MNFKKTLTLSLSHTRFLSQTFVKSHHKVGVLRIKRGQSSEEDIFANSNEPGSFDEFLNVLGKVCMG